MLRNDVKVNEAEAELAQHHATAVKAQAELKTALKGFQEAQNRMLVSKLDQAIASQRTVEEEALQFTKNVNSLYQRAAKWKAEQKRFRAALDGFDNIGDWAARMELDLRAIAGNLEYVCSVLEKEQQGENGAVAATASGGRSH